MVRELVHDPIFLGQKCEEAAIEDLEAAEDLYDTLDEHNSECVGMAANMIGVKKRIICFYDGNACITMFNPVILSKSEPYETEEGCLSLLGGPRKTKRYKKSAINSHFFYEAFLLS